MTLSKAPDVWDGTIPVTQAWVLRAIADRLDEMNKWWEEELDQQLRNP